MSNRFILVEISQNFFLLCINYYRLVSFLRVYISFFAGKGGLARERIINLRVISTLNVVCIYISREKEYETTVEIPSEFIPLAHRCRQ